MCINIYLRLLEIVNKIKKASPEKSQPLLTYEKHQVKITLKIQIRNLFFGTQFAFFQPGASEIPFLPMI